MGFVIRLVKKSPIKELKAFRRLVDPIPVITDERWKLATWIKEYYYCSIGEALSVMVPTTMRLVDKPNKVEKKSHLATLQKPHHLSLVQQEAYQSIMDTIKQSVTATFLLHGVTGSGKTEIYLQVISYLLAQGKSAICLVPEIAITPQTIDRFEARFGDRVAVWHSRLTIRQRADSWTRLESGEAQVVIGARSAVFTPIRNLGLIVIDEEHEQTYKQGDTPRYHAREVAISRARLNNASVILGSATPSIESYYAATKKHYQLLNLPERIHNRPMPTIEIIDMREELKNRRRLEPLSGRMQRLIERAVSRQEQTILFLNRRGFARTAQCKTCGEVVRCKRCSVPLIFHAARNELVCHYCNAHETPAEMCPMCHKGYLRFRGTGTERVESELHRYFPSASIARMDSDSTTHRDAHRLIYEALKTEQVSLLIGTQMIAKGHDFPGVTLVGVISGDTALNLPDFRSGERTFDLLTQVAGRAGRGDQPGHVLIQTFCPDHYAIQAASRHDYDAFYQEEIIMRKRLKLPPVKHFVELTLRASSKNKAESVASALMDVLKQRAKRQRITLIGPSPHRIPWMRKQYRLSLVLQAKTAEKIVKLLREMLEPGRRYCGMPITVDVDPL